MLLDMFYSKIINIFINLRHLVKKIFTKIIFDNNKKVNIETENINLIHSIPRYTEDITNILGSDLKFVDSASFLFLYNEIFKKEIYKFKSDSEKPYIIDCGANIGISIIYFKKIYPNAEIIGFEPDSKVFEALKFNLNSFGLNDVLVYNKGLWNETGSLKFYAEGADGGRIALKSDNKNIKTIETIRLREFINKPVELLKIDIEGAETIVLEDIKDLLHYVKYIFIEYHSFINEKQTLHKLLDILISNEFRVNVNFSGLTSAQPFMKINTYENIDMLLNIYGWNKKII
jgi:FkbM family methyltransferase